MSELKPCPFCGGEADEYEGEYGNGIYCMECGATVGYPIHLGFNVAERVSYEQAIAAWNKRADRIEVYPDGESGISINGITYVPIVRCRDCTVYDGEGYGCSYGRGDDHDGFCAWGVRRDA